MPIGPPRTSPRARRIAAASGLALMLLVLAGGPAAYLLAGSLPWVIGGGLVLGPRFTGEARVPNSDVRVTRTREPSGREFLWIRSPTEHFRSELFRYVRGTSRSGGGITIRTWRGWARIDAATATR